MNMNRNFGFIKIVCVIVVATLIMTFFTACGSSPVEGVSDATAAAEEKLDIVIIKYDDKPKYNNACDGFIESLKAKGFIEDETITLDVICCDGDKDKCAEAVKDLKLDGVDLIYAIGQIPAVDVSKVTDKIPVVFGCVEDPIKAGLLKSTQKPDKNVTGVSDFIPVYNQLKLVTNIWPNAKNISVIYSETSERSVLFSALVMEYAKDLKLKLTAYPMHDENDADSVLKKALKKCDALYVAEDSVTKKCIDKITEKAEKKNVPVLSTTETFLKNGAFGTCVHDYVLHGSSAGDMAVVILKGLKSVGEIPVFYPDDCRVVLSDTSEDGIKDYIEQNTETVELK